MPPNGEAAGAIDEAEKAKQEIIAKVKEISEEKDAKVRAEKKEILKKELLEELKQRKVATHEVLERGVVDARDEARAVKRSVMKVLEAVKQGIITPPEHAKVLMANLADKPLQLTDHVAVQLYSFISKYLTTEILLGQPGQPLTDFEKALDELSKREPMAGNVIRESILEKPEKFGLTKEKAEERLDEELGQSHVSSAAEDSFEKKRYEVMRMLNVEGASRNVIPDEKALRVAEALISKESLLTFIQEIKTQIKGNNPGLSEAEIQKKVSVELELRILLFYDNVFTNLDKHQPTKYYQEITAKDPYYNFQVVFDRLEKQLGQLADNLSGSSEGEDFWKIDHERFDEEREYTTEGGKKEKIRYLVDRIRPYPIRKAASLPDFLKYLQIVVNHEQDMREFLHNATAMFHNPAGEGGFYKQLAGYAEKMRSSDIDMFLATADNKFFMEAFNLYHKITQKEFAKYDWRHPEALFEVYQGNMTKIEHQVMERLRKMHGGDVEEWRLIRAMKMAVGASLGVFMTEVENAAYADPNLDEKGSFSFKSYYRNDAAAIGPLNPFTHDFWRWQQAGTLMSDMLFLPIQEKMPEKWWQRLHPKNWRVWDHTKVYKELKGYREEFEQRKKLTPLEDSIRLIDMQNPGRIGGPITRGGWRTYYSFEDWLVWKSPEGRPTEIFNFEESWKAIENIGFEPLLNFVGKFDMKHFEGNELREFFEYVYDKYQTSGDMGFGDYFAGIEQKIEKLSDFKGTKHQKEEHVKEKTKEIYQDELFKILARALKQRVPTIFLRLERGRFMEKGKGDRILDKLQDAYGAEEAEKIVDNIILAETLLREETSSYMIKGIEEGKRLNEVEYHGYKYELTPEKLRSLLKASGVDGAEIDTAVEALSTIRDSFLTTGYLDKFSEKIKQNGKGGPRTDLPFAIAPDEFDMRFINFRSAGSRVLARLTGELNHGEEKMYAHLKNFGKILKETSLDGKHDMSNLIKAFEDIEEYMETLHGKEYAYQWVDHLAQVAIAYFRKDTWSRNFLTKFLRIGKYNSMAAEISGKFRGVWEWEVADIHHFISSLERKNIFQKDPFDVSKVKVEPRKIFGREEIFGISFGNKVTRGHDFKYYGHRLSKVTGSTIFHIGSEIINKYIPLFLLAVLWIYVSQAFKDASGEKKH